MVEVKEGVLLVVPRAGLAGAGAGGDLAARGRGLGSCDDVRLRVGDFDG